MNVRPSDAPPRSRSLRFHLTAALIAVVLVAILLLGGLNFFAARALLESGAQDRLAGIGQSRARSIEAGAERLRGRVSSASTDLAVTVALEELTASYDQVTDSLNADSDAELEAVYQAELIDPLLAAGLGPITVEELAPRSDAGRYLQYQYLIGPRLAGATPRDIADPEDGSDYSVTHAQHHDYLAELATQLTGGDLLLISAAGDVVYSVEKRIDFGTNLDTGPYRSSTLASALRDQLGRVPPGDAVIADWEIYLPGGGLPTLFMVAAVRRDTRVLGAIAVQVPSASFSAITTADQEWEAVGLRTGESYVVGSDMVLRSESRLWIEDPDAYLARIDDPRDASLIETFGSPVGIQRVETTAVEAGIEGEAFDGQSSNYLGDATFSSAVPIDVEGVDWIVVVDTPLSDARARLVDYLQRMGLVLALLLPAAGLVGYGLAGRLARPIPPIVELARAVAEGEREPEVESDGGDELSDLSRRLRRTAETLGHQEEELEAEFESKRKLLLSVLPARLVDPEGEIGRSTEAIETTTVIAVSFEATATAGGDAFADAPVEVLASVSETAGSLAEERDIEPVRFAADRHLFLAGVGSSSDGADEALDFAVELVSSARAHARHEDVTLTIHIGLSTGPVATGVLNQGSLTFGAWGDPVRRALAIAALSRADEILVDSTTSAATDPERFAPVPAEDVISLDGAPMALVAVQT